MDEGRIHGMIPTCKMYSLNAHQLLVNIFLGLRSDVLEHRPGLEPRHVGGVLPRPRQLCHKYNEDVLS